MNPIVQLLLHVKKARSALDKGKRADVKNNSSRNTIFAASSTSVVPKVDITPTSSPWDLLPVELQIKIFTHCGVKDWLPSRLVCKGFYQILTSHEQLISRQYLRHRRHGTLPSPIESERTYTRNPEDDVVLLSDLFPPSKSAKGGHLYTFRYVNSLRRRQKLCSRLCYYVAERVMDRFVKCEAEFVKSMFTSKKERNALVQRGMASLWYKLTPLMYYTLYFLESYSLARREHTNTLLREFEAGRLPVPIPPNLRKSMYRELQVKILRSPPFTDASTLVSTHHCMQLIFSYLRHTVPPDEQGLQDDGWIGSLLTVSPFLRLVEYFSAEIGDGGNQRMQRKEFMHNFDNDIMSNEKDDRNSLVFESAPNWHAHTSADDIWFDVAREELALRRAFPHATEKIWIWNQIPLLLGCQHCRDDPGGWRA